MTKKASTDRLSPKFPHLCELWDCEGRLVFVAGNSVDGDGMIWLFDWNTADVAYRPVALLTECVDRQSLTEDVIVTKMTGWSHQGHSDAMWWLAWWHEGKHHAKSVWYYVAAMRANPSKHAWVLDRLYSDARSACMCEGVSSPDLGFLINIPEMQGCPIASDWAEAVSQAEIAVHMPALLQEAAQIHKVEDFAPSFTPVDH